MVQLEELPDKPFIIEEVTGSPIEEATSGAKESEQSKSTDSGEEGWEDESEIETHSSSSEDDDDSVFDETFGQRVSALRDMIAPAYRAQIQTATSTSINVVHKMLSVSSKILWVIGTSTLLLGVPWAMAFAEDQHISEMEKEECMRAIGNEVLTKTTLGQPQSAEAQPAL